MKKVYEKPCVEVIDFSFKDRIMDVNVEGDDPVFDESVPDVLE